MPRDSAKIEMNELTAPKPHPRQSAVQAVDSASTATMPVRGDKGWRLPAGGCRLSRAKSETVQATSAM